MLIKKILNNICTSFIKIWFLISIYSRIPASSNNYKKIKKLRGFIRGLFLDIENGRVSLNEINSGLIKKLLDDYYRLVDSKYNSVQTLFDENYKHTSKPKILIVSHEFSLTGAPKAALMLAKAVKSIWGVSPLVSTIKDGEIKKEFNLLNIPTFELWDINWSDQKRNKFLNQFDIVIVNSCSWELLHHLDGIDVPVIWWTHENFNKKECDVCISPFIHKIDQYWAGSPTALNILQARFPQVDNKLLMYGLDDIFITKKENDKVVFSVMGTITQRKGQDVYVRAIQLLPDQIRERAIFFIIGKQSSDKYTQKIFALAKNTPEIIFIDEVPFDKLLEYYEKSDVIVVPSRNDPMPIVATYGLMFSRLCVVSDAAGTSLLLKDNENSLIFKNEDYKGLSKLLQSIISNKSSYSSVMENSRRVYEENFSNDQFKKKIKSMIENLVNVEK